MDIGQVYADLNIVQDFVPVGSSNRPGDKLVAESVTIHNTDNDSPGADAAAHARYQKGADARARQVSWHFTVDDNSVYQSLPTNEIGWHSGTAAGNHSSLGVEICMNPEMDVAKGYRRAALLTAVLLQQNQISLAGGVKQHHDWSGKNCPRVLRARPNGWLDFLAAVSNFHGQLSQAQVAPVAIDVSAVADHHHAG